MKTHEHAERLVRSLGDPEIYMRRLSSVSPTVASVVEIWLEDLRTTNARSFYERESVVRCHFTRAIMLQRVDELTQDRVRAWMLSKIAVGYKKEMCRKILGTLKACLRFGFERGLLDNNPGPLFKLPFVETAPRTRGKLETRYVISLVRLEAVPFQERLLFAVLLLTGSRIGEAAGLSWGDWAPDTKPLGELRIARQWDCKRKILVPTKTKEPRSVPVHPELAALLELARERFRETFHREPTAEDPVCAFYQPGTGRTAWRWSETTALRRFQKALKGLGSEHRVLHDARHWFISALHNNGAHPTSAKSLTHDLGRFHEYWRYVHVDWVAKCEAITALNAVLGPSRRPCLSPMVGQGRGEACADARPRRTR